jgi:glycosyltransferase involved in cell wall biosynthesis
MSDLGRVRQKVRTMLRRGASDGARIGEVAIGAEPRRIVHPRVLPWHHYGPVHAFNTRSLLRSIREALAELGTTERPLLVTGTPPSVGVVGQLDEIASIYFCMDDFLHLPSTSPRMLAPLEERLLERVDAVVATAESLTRTKRPRSGRVYHLPQGVNYEHIAAPRPVPADLAALPRPIIGFAGSIYDRIDFGMLDQVAAAFPGGSVVLVGPVEGPAPRFRQANVHLLGVRPYRELPAYVQAFDVGLIPYVLNRETIAVDPLKLLEYLAAGIPVVSTDLPEIRQRGEVVSIAGTRDDFVAAVLGALAHPRNTRAERQALAREHGWDRRAQRLLDIFDEVIAR